MLDIGDPAFKLFGKTIPLFSADELSGDSNNAALNSKNSEKGQVEQKSSDGSVLKGELDADNETASKKVFNSSDDQNSPNSTDENSAAESDEKEQSKNYSDKTLKKPDKILPCPRCNSMDTKFCYFNNYNVNQPRHFCKSCQRYWTAGGTMRKVPVGAGRRKNKTATSSKYCHLSISEALQAESGLKTNGTVLSFGADSPLCDSMASMMSLREKKIVNVGIMEEDAPKIQTIPFPGFYPVMPIYPVPYWNGAVNSWNVPFVSPCLMSPKSPVSPKLGKHLREDDILMTPAGVGSPRVLVPKTLRIDDPEEAAKSSIWTTLGIKKAESAGNGGFFKGLESKSDKNHKIESFPVLDSNPAALARSVSFRETV